MAKRQPEQIELLSRQLQELTELLSSQDIAHLPMAEAKQIRKSFADAIAKIRKIMEDLDPIKHPGFVFDPSNPAIVGRFVGITLIAQPRKPLLNIEKFYGSGVYAIYYNGDFHAYTAISKKEHPIYVGKADPVSQSSKTAIEQGDKLSGRLNEHRKNISKATSTLCLEHFEYRALVVQTGWQSSAENFLIHLFRPIWNSEVGICYGFGKHGDDPTTRANLRSPWDTLHPGRDWAHREPSMKDAKLESRILREISEHLSKYEPISSVDEILKRFLEEMRSVT